MAIPYTRRQLIQRIRKHMSNGYPSDSWSTSDNEISLYIDQSIAFNLVGLAWNNVKLTGVIEVPEAYQITYLLSGLQQDGITGEWTAALPQPPVSLPLGYSISRVYPADPTIGLGQDFLPIKTKRAAYRNFMPRPTGGEYRSENNIIRLRANNNMPLLDIPFYVQMPTTRANDLNSDMNLPDDVIQATFNDVVKWLTQRYAQPKDIVHDDLPSGNNNLKS